MATDNFQPRLNQKCFEVSFPTKILSRRFQRKAGWAQATAEFAFVIEYFGADCSNGLGLEHGLDLVSKVGFCSAGPSGESQFNVFI